MRVAARHETVVWWRLWHGVDHKAWAVTDVAPAREARGDAAAGPAVAATDPGPDQARSARNEADPARNEIALSLPEPAGPPRAAAPRWRRLAFLVARLTFTVAILAAVAYATVRQWPDVRQTLTHLAWESVVLSFLMVLAGLAAQTLAWRAALADVGHRVGVQTAGQIYLIGLLAKYLPGSIWTFVLQMELGKRANLPRSRAFLASMVSLGLSTTAALALGAFGLPVLFQIDDVTTAVVLTIVPVAVICAHPRVLTWLVQRFLRLVRRPQLDTPITWRGVGVVIGWSSLAWVCFGLHLWLLANAESAPGVGGVLRCIGAFALGLTAGMVAFLSPSGLGVREAIITAALLPYVPPGVALGMALASRMIFTVADLVSAGVAALTALRTAR
jgi:glycosyltransferase 2 family protein